MFRTAVSLLLLGFTIAAENPTACLTEVDPNTDYFPDKVSPSHSKLWSIKYHNTYKILTNEQVGDSYLLYLCGSQVPEDVNATLKIPIPIQGYSLTSTTQVSHMELLEVDVHAKAYLTGSQYISSNCFTDRIKAGDIADVNVFASPVPDALRDVVTFANPTGGEYQKNLTNLVTVNEYLEKTNLAIGEWHKFYSVFFNAEKKANDDFDGMEQRFDCTAANAQRVSDGSKKKVAWGQYSTWSKAWTSGSCPNYYCDWVEKCGGEFLTPENSGSMDAAQFVEYAKDADILVWSDFSSGLNYTQYKDTLDQLKASKDKMVFDLTKFGISTWYEHRLVEFDVVLEDFCTLIAGENIIPHKREFLRNVFTEETGEPPACVQGKPSFTLKADECTNITAPSGDNSAAARTVGNLVAMGALVGSMLV